MLSHLNYIAHAVVDNLHVLFAAGRVAGAVEHGAMPDGRDLHRLGIEPSAFSAIRLG